MELPKRLWIGTVALGAGHIAGLPFHQNRLLGAAFYAVAEFGAYPAIRHFYESVRQAA